MTEEGKIEEIRVSKRIRKDLGKEAIQIP